MATAVTAEKRIALWIERASFWSSVTSAALFVVVIIGDVAVFGFGYRPSGWPLVFLQFGPLVAGGLGVIGNATMYFHYLRLIVLWLFRHVKIRWRRVTEEALVDEALGLPQNERQAIDDAARRGRARLRGCRMQVTNVVVVASLAMVAVTVAPAPIPVLAFEHLLATPSPAIALQVAPTAAPASAPLPTPTSSPTPTPTPKPTATAATVFSGPKQITFPYFAAAPGLGCDAGGANWGGNQTGIVCFSDHTLVQGEFSPPQNSLDWIAPSAPLLETFQTSVVLSNLTGTNAALNLSIEAQDKTYILNVANIGEWSVERCSAASPTCDVFAQNNSYTLPSSMTLTITVTTGGWSFGINGQTIASHTEQGVSPLTGIDFGMFGTQMNLANFSIG